MYICHECGYEFDNPAKIQETHGLSSLPFEIICVCPRCSSTNYKKTQSDFCRCCGARLREGKTDYCSMSCKKRGEKLWQRELNRKKILTDNPLFKVLRENEAYNKKHGTRLSYGQFVALLSLKKKRRRKNG